MIVEEERLVCTNTECVVEFIVTRKSDIEIQNLRCVCGNALKKVYRPPVLAVYGTASEIGRLNVDLGGTLARLENLKWQPHSTGQ